MKKFFVSAGLTAAGTATLFAAYAPDVQSGKWWTVSASLRGFYDDNYATASNKKGSYGFELLPQIQASVPLQQTEIGARYTYGLYYYEERDHLGQNPIDQSHDFDLWVDHAFTERVQAKVLDTFTVSQEPELDTGTTLVVPYRIEGDNIANHATLSLTTDWTRELSTVFRYQNNWYDYQNSGATTNNFSTQGASLAGTLNRVEQTGSIDAQWHFSTETMAFVGYAFQQVNYIGDEPIAGSAFVPGGYYYSNSRDNRSHLGYVGAQYNLLQNLALMGKAGIQYNDDYNDPLFRTTALNPYVDISATYTYLPGSYAQLGFTHQRNATDIVAVNALNGQITQDQESSLVYGSINHHITPKLMGTILASYQNSVFHEGAYNNDADDIYSLGLNLSYAFTKHFSADTGYNWDDVKSQIAGRSYQRSRVYLGIAATY